MSASVRKRQQTVKSARPTRTPAGDAFTELVVLILRLEGLLAAAGDELAQPVGQTSARWRLLASIENGPSTVAQIARAWGLARQSVQRVADLLVREGFAEYVENPEHRRAQLLVLTGPGRGALRRIQRAQRGWADRIGAEIGEADLGRANAVLSRVFGVLVDRPREAAGAAETPVRRR